MHLPAPAARGYVQASAVSSGKEQPMTETSRHDAWQAGDSCDSYMGRWSRRIAPRFLDWLDAPDGADWLEVGCGTGALSAAIVAPCRPARKSVASGKGVAVRVEAGGRRD